MKPEYEKLYETLSTQSFENLLNDATVFHMCLSAIDDWASLDSDKCLLEAVEYWETANGKELFMHVDSRNIEQHVKPLVAFVVILKSINDFHSLSVYVQNRYDEDLAKVNALRGLDYAYEFYADSSKNDSIATLMTYVEGKHLIVSGSYKKGRDKLLSIKGDFRDSRDLVSKSYKEEKKREADALEAKWTKESEVSLCYLDRRFVEIDSKWARLFHSLEHPLRERDDEELLKSCVLYKSLPNNTWKSDYEYLLQQTKELLKSYEKFQSAYCREESWMNEKRTMLSKRQRMTTHSNSRMATLRSVLLEAKGLNAVLEAFCDMSSLHEPIKLLKRAVCTEAGELSETQKTVSEWFDFCSNIDTESLASINGFLAHVADEAGIREAATRLSKLGNNACVKDKVNELERYADLVSQGRFVASGSDLNIVQTIIRNCETTRWSKEKHREERERWFLPNEGLRTPVKKVLLTCDKERELWRSRQFYGINAEQIISNLFEDISWYGHVWYSDVGTYVWVSTDGGEYLTVWAVRHSCCESKYGPDQSWCDYRKVIARWETVWCREAEEFPATQTSSLVGTCPLKPGESIESVARDLQTKWEAQEAARKEAARQREQKRREEAARKREEEARKREEEARRKRREEERESLELELGLRRSYTEALSELESASEASEASRLEKICDKIAYILMRLGWFFVVSSLAVLGAWFIFCDLLRLVTSSLTVAAGIYFFVGAPLGFLLAGLGCLIDGVGGKLAAGRKEALDEKRCAESRVEEIRAQSQAAGYSVGAEENAPRIEQIKQRLAQLEKEA